jgi:hypothetical protein
VVDPFRLALPGDIRGVEPAVSKDTGKLSVTVVVGFVSHVFTRKSKCLWGETVGEEHSARSEQVPVSEL